MVNFTDNDEFIQAEVSRSVTPMKVTAVAVVAIILACLYLLGAFGGAGSLAIQVFAPQVLEPQFDSDDPQFKLQMEFQKETNAMSKQFFWLFIIQTIVYTVLGVVLLVQAIQAVRQDEAIWYRRLGQTLMIAIGVELLAAMMTGFFQWGQWNVIHTLTTPEGAGGQTKLFKSLLIYSTIFGIVLTWIWQIVKLVYLCLGAMVVKTHASLMAQSK